MPLYGEPFTRECPWCGKVIEAAYEREWSTRYADHLYQECHHVYDVPGADDE